MATSQKIKEMRKFNYYGRIFHDFTEKRSVTTISDVSIQGIKLEVHRLFKIVTLGYSDHNINLIRDIKNMYLIETNEKQAIFKEHFSEYDYIFVLNK